MSGMENAFVVQRRRSSFCAVGWYAAPKRRKHREQPAAQRANDLEGGTFAWALSLTRGRHLFRVWKRDKRRTVRLDAAQSFPGSKAAGLRCQLDFRGHGHPKRGRCCGSARDVQYSSSNNKRHPQLRQKYCAPFRKSCRRRGRDVSFEQICSWPLIGFDERSGLTPPPAGKRRDADAQS